MSNSTTTSSHAITCKAAVVYGAGEELRLEEIRVDPPKRSEVRIKMICANPTIYNMLAPSHSKSCVRHCIHGFPVPLFPRVVGHEGVGVVESIGEGVTEVVVGDIVMPTYIGECGGCENCKSGKANLCHVYSLSMDGLMLDGTSRMSTIGGGERLYQHFSCSTLSEYTVVNVNFLVKIDPRIPHVHASFISCGFTTGFGSTWKTAAVHKGSTVAVLGLGAVGLGAVEGARTQGASRIIGVDTNEWKHEKGKVFGMNEFINPSNHPDKSVSELIKDVTGGLGVDYCFECTGISTFVAQALESTKAGIGTAVIIGAAETAKINIVPLLCGRSLKGCVFGGIRIKSDIPTILGKTINKELHLDELSTHQFRLNEINEALETMKQPDCIKVVIQF